MDGSVVIALFRHGITALNKQKAYIGWTDDPIAEEEKERLANQAYYGFPYDFVMSSDLMRCLQTAEILFPWKKVYQMAQFRELHFGEWEGKTYEQLKNDMNYTEWLNAPFEVTPPGGENFQMFKNRVDEGWRQVVEMIDNNRVKKIAIVTHEGVIRDLLLKYANSRKQFWEWHVAHGAGYELIWNCQAAFRRGERCTLLREVPLTANQHG